MDEQEKEEFEQVKASSIRSCEVILYPPSATMLDVQKVILEHSVKDYACILHDKDDKKDHIHAMLWLANPTPFESVVKWFADLGVTATNIGRIKSKKGALAYLTHSNRPNKHVYPIESVWHSDGIKEELETATSEAKRKNDIKAMCDKVALGEMSPRSLYTALSGVEVRENRKLIDGSVEARLIKASTLKEKNMKVIYICGPSGSGKSTLARFYASMWSTEAPYISSSSNDPLQDYNLEPVIILDDLRGDSFKFADLLKLLDNHVPSSVKCRYRNKSIDAKYLIITSTRKPQELYSADTFSADDNLDQLKRRINALYRIDKDGSIYQGCYTYNEKKKTREAVMQSAPVSNMEMVFKQMNILEKASNVLNEISEMFASLGKKKQETR